MSKTANNVGQVCNKEEFDRFRSIHKRFTKYVQEPNSLRFKKLEKLGDDIEEFWPKLVEIGKVLGIDLSDKFQILIDILEEGLKPVHPSTYINRWSGGGPDWAFDDAVAGEFAKYEAKLKERREFIANLDKVMVALYASQPKDKNHGLIFNIQNSNVLLGNVRQPGNVRVGNHTQIEEQMKNNSQKDEISSRINVLCSDLRNFRADFIRGAVVFGSCQANNIPDKFKPKDKDLPNNMECRLRISFGNNQHKFRFSKFTGQETYDDLLINNTGLEDYINMLGDIWPEGGYSWLIEKPEHIELLNQKADHIYELSKPLLKIEEYRSDVAEVRKTVRPDDHPWTTRSTVKWSYIDKLEDIIKRFDSAVAIKPAETEQKDTAAKIINIENFKGILGDVQAENVQTGDHASIQKQTVTAEKKKGIVRKVLKIVGAIIVGIIASLLADILCGFGWFERIKTIIHNILTSK